MNLIKQNKNQKTAYKQVQIEFCMQTLYNEYCCR
jgi:hypothetical protein